MGEYIRAEFFKVSRRKYPYFFLLIIVALEALLAGGWAFTNARGNHIDFSTGAGMLPALLSVGLYCALLTGDMVFSDQYKFNTLKNEVSFGLPRPRIYLGKLFVSCITALLLCVVVVAAYLGMCWVLLPHEVSAVGDTFRAVGFCVLTALPLWLGGQAVVILLFFLCKSTTVASFLYVGIIAALPSLFKLLGALVSPVFRHIYEIMLTTPLDTVTGSLGDWGFFARACAIGAGWFLISTILGVLLLRKKEIN